MIICVCVCAAASCLFCVMAEWPSSSPIIISYLCICVTANNKIRTIKDTPNDVSDGTQLLPVPLSLMSDIFGGNNERVRATFIFFPLAHEKNIEVAKGKGPCCSKEAIIVLVFGSLKVSVASSFVKMFLDLVEITTD